MGDNSAIEWTDATWQTITAAKRIGVPVEEYLSRRRAGEKWCTKCRAWHPIIAFGSDARRGDGLAASCLASRRVRQRALQLQRQRKGWIEPTRDGDKRQARSRINHLVDIGQLPDPEDLPCTDCADEVFMGHYRHEYDHAHGYDGPNQLYVEPVCSKCHHNREDARHG